MKTDLEKFRELYDSIGIQYTLGKNGDGELAMLLEVDTQLPRKERKVGEYKERRGLVGYSGFLTEIVFDERGKLIYQGVWE